MARVDLNQGIAPLAGSVLAMERLQLDPSGAATVGDGVADTLLFVFHGAGALDDDAVTEGTAALVPAGERAALAAHAGGLEAVLFSVGAGTDLHAPIGPRERVVTTDQVEPGKATGQPLVPGAVRPAQRLDARDAVRRLHPAGQGAVALPPVRRDRLGMARAGPLPSRRDGGGARRQARRSG